MNILLSGGGGRLGTELKRILSSADSSRQSQNIVRGLPDGEAGKPRTNDGISSHPNGVRTIELVAPSIKKWDITKPADCRAVLKKYEPDVVVHAAAYTDVAKAEEEKDVCRRVNVAGTTNVSNAIKEILPKAHLVYISTDYVFSGDKGHYKEGDATKPVNFYALTKLEGEREAKRALHHHIIRTSFKPRPFEHPKAVKDMWTSADYIDVIAQEIALAVKNYKLLPSIIHIATERKSVFALAKQSNPKVKPIKRADIKSVVLPKDTSLDIGIWKKLKSTM